MILLLDFFVVHLSKGNYPVQKELISRCTHVRKFFTKTYTPPPDAGPSLSVRINKSGPSELHKIPLFRLISSVVNLSFFILYSHRLLLVISDGNFKRIIKMVKIDYKRIRKRIKRFLDEIFFLIIEL